MMFKPRVRHWTDVSVLRILRGRMRWWQNAGHSPNDWTDSLVHCLLLWLADDLGQSRAVVGVREVVGRIEDAGVFGEVVVVIGGSLGHWADLAGLIEVELGVFWGKDGVCGADHRANLGSGHVEECSVQISS